MVIRVTQLNPFVPSRQEKYSVQIDWSEDNSPSIQWLAFPSHFVECNIMRVTEGQVVVLVHELYIRDNFGVTYQRSPAVDGTRYPVYGFVELLVLTSIPVYRDAPYNETNRKYFEFKRYKIYKYFEIFIYFNFNYIIYFPQIFLIY